MHIFSFAFIVLLLAQIACQESALQEDRRGRSAMGTGGSATASDNAKEPALDAAGEVLSLSWDASQGKVTGYHVFGLIEEKNTGGKEFASLGAASENLSLPAVKIKLSETSLPKKGKICFYVVAENAGSRSEGSTPVCMTR
jgi:hypothetical protein